MTKKNKAITQNSDDGHLETIPVVLVPKGDPDKVTFVVTEKISSLAHGDKSYQVVEGKVSLPAAENWYDDMIRAGILKLP